MTCKTARIAGLLDARNGILAMSGGTEDDSVWDTLTDRAFALEDRIIETPAETAADLEAKAALALAAFKADADVTLRRALTALRGDLQRLTAAGFA